MRKEIDIRELLEFAISIEKNGYKFYTETAKKFSTLQTIKLFHYLAEEELKHEHFFRDLLSLEPEFRSSPTLQSAYEIFRRDFLNSFTFADGAAMPRSIETVQTPEEAIEQAILFEKDTVVLYSSIRKHINPSHHARLNVIIDEELGHIGRLLSLRESMEIEPDTEQYR